MNEFELIDKLTRRFSIMNPEVVKAIGDDAAVISLGSGQALTVSTDLLVQDIHFDLSYVPLELLGYKSVTVNLSDIYAMNTLPFGITVGLALAPGSCATLAEGIYRGIELACRGYNVDLLGGDLSSSRGPLCISVTALGKGRVDTLTYRSGARESNLVCVSGRPGLAAAGLRLLKLRKECPNAYPRHMQMRFDKLIEQQLRPEARGDVVGMLDKLGILPSAMIDISDGLASEIWHICRSSGQGGRIYVNSLPIDDRLEEAASYLNVSAQELVLYGGEDYELLFTVDSSYKDKVGGLEDVTIIGKLMPACEGVQLITSEGRAVALQAGGWDHFATPSGLGC